MSLPRRRLGRSGIEVSCLGWGSVKLGRARGVKYPKPFRIPDDREAAALLKLAWDCGINLIDTAPAYGTSEERLGKLLEGERDRWILSSKVGEEFNGVDSRFDFSPAGVRRSVERSLMRLRTDRLDIVLIHSDGNDREILERLGTLEALMGLKQEGKVRAVGMSGKTVEGALLAIERGADVVMVSFSAWDRTEEPAIDAAQAAEVGVLVKKAFSSGHFGAGGSARVGLEGVLGHPGVGSAIIGTIDAGHLRENCGFAKEFALSAQMETVPASATARGSEQSG